MALAVFFVYSIFQAAKGPHMLRKMLLAMVSCGAVVLGARATTLNEPVGTSSAVTIATMQIAVAGTLNQIAVTTQGVAGLDFNVISGGTCLVGSVYSVGQTCTVDYTFTPTAPGARYGGIVLNTSAGAVLSTQYLQGIGMGPLVHFTPGKLVSLPLINEFVPASIAADAADNLYLDIAVSINSPNNAVLKETRTATGYTQSIVAMGLAYPVQAAVDGVGNVFVADQDSYQIYKETPTSTGYVQSNFFSGAVEGVAVDGGGNVYISYLDYGIVKCTLSNGVYTQSRIFTTNYNTQLAVDGNGAVYLGAVGIVLTPQANGSYGATSFPGGYSMAIDANGNVFAGEQFHTALWEETPTAGGYTTTTLGNYAAGVGGVALDGGGNLYFGAGGGVMEFDYTDPPTLNFATTAVGATSTDSPKTVMLLNAGNAPLIFTPGPLGDPSISSGFRVDSNSTCPLLFTNASSTTLGAQAACTYGIDFSPGVPGTIVGELTALDNAPAVSGTTGQTVTLIGQANTGPPTVTAVSPSRGLPAGGTSVSISGTGFYSVSSVSFGGAAATSYVVNGASSISAMSPAGVGTVDITVTTAEGTSATSVADQYTYANPLPQTIAFAAPSQPAYVATSVALSATASSGMPVTYTVVSGPANVSGSTLTYSGAGTVVVEADQAGGNGFNAAQPVQVSVTATLLQEPVGATSGPVITLVTISSPGTLNTATAFTEGAANGDFTASLRGLGAGVNASGYCAAGVAYAAGQTCAVVFTFNPTRPGQRYGGLLLSDGAGNAMANSHVYGVGMGPQVGFLPGTQGLLGSGLNQPSGVAVDGNGNVFVSEYGGGLAEITAAGVQGSVGSFGVTSDVAVDGSGDLIVTGQHNVYEVLAVNGSVPATPTVVTLGTGFSLINGVAVDATGDVFVATGTGTASDGALYELPAVNGVIVQPPTPVSLGSGFGQLTGVAVDSSGDIYVSDGGKQAVYELIAVNGVVPASPVMRSLGGGFTLPSNVRLDAANDVYLTDAGASAVYEILAVNGSVPSTNATVRTLGTGFSSPQGLVVDAKGNLFFADFGQADVVTLDYSDTPTLNFATTAVGATSTDSPQTATLFNNGNSPLTFDVPASGTNASISAGFTIGSGSSCPQLTSTSSAPPTLAAGGYCTELVSFTPVAAGVDKGKLIATDNALNMPGAMQTVLLNGTGLAATSTTLTSLLNPAGVGVSVTFRATVTSASGTPTGTVTFTDGVQGSNAMALLGTVTLVNGVATLSTSSLTLGTHIITATYAATAAFGASSASLTQVVGYQSVTTTAVSPEPSTYGQTVTFTVHVAGAAGSTGTPSGTVTLVFCHGTTIAITLDASGNGSVMQPYVNELSEPAGSCPYTANYAGDSFFFPSASASTAYIVNPSASTTTGSGAPNPGFLGQTVTLTATVAGNPSPSLGSGGVILPPGSTVATGTVQFFDGAVSLGSATVSGTQTASLATSALALGTHSITAVYSGDANLSGSTSIAFLETIELAPTSTTLSATPNPGEQNHAETIVVNVAALLGAAAPVGSVAITDGGVLLTTLNVLTPNGLLASASYAATGLTPGTHLLQAFFTSASGFLPSQSGVVALVIVPQDFTLTANPPSMTVQTEHHQTMTLELASLGGFAANIALSCNGPVPKWVTCYLPEPVALAGDATVPVSFTIDTDAVKFFKSEAAPVGPRGRSGVVLAGLLPLALLGFGRRRRGLLQVLALVGLSLAAMGMTACTGYYPAHTEPGTYTVTVTAVGTAAGAAMATTHTLDVTLVVTP
jgi:sugar lactone lactonase YvrE